MGKAIMMVEGLDGQIELLPDRVVIYRKGLFNAITYGFNATREIPLSAISEIMFRKSGFQFGTIEFIRSGSSVVQQGKSRHSTVRFNKKSNDAFAAFKEKTFEMMEKYRIKNQ